MQVLDNPTKFTNPFQFEITFECRAPGIKEELEWKLVYVGSADDEKYDQELDNVLVGPVQVGKNKFVFQAPAPDINKIPEKDLLEVTVLLLTCSYREREFIRIGYYVNNDFVGEEGQPLDPAARDVSKLRRNILADKPRVTRFPIPWDDSDAPIAAPTAQEEADLEKRLMELKEAEGMVDSSSGDEMDGDDQGDGLSDEKEQLIQDRDHLGHGVQPVLLQEMEMS